MMDVHGFFQSIIQVFFFPIYKFAILAYVLYIMRIL